MSRGEASDLAAHVRREASLAKSMAGARSAELLANFEQQLATEYKFTDDGTWRQAAEDAEAAVREASARITERCRELGIPEWARPFLGSAHWYGRSEGALAERRAELRKVAMTRLAAMEKAAKVEIERASLGMQRTLLSGVLSSGEAQAFLAQLPTAADLMPALALADVAKALGRGGAA